MFADFGHFDQIEFFLVYIMPLIKLVDLVLQLLYQFIPSIPFPLPSPFILSLGT